ncbi:MAG: hypothetical protein WCD18_13370 [Thermosynechococcaceae cyanobacterium]
MLIDLLQMGAHVLQPDPSALNTLSHFGADHLWMAQTFKQDLFGDFSKSWDYFIRSGQVWALVIGVVVGYIFRSITSY